LKITAETDPSNRLQRGKFVLAMDGGWIKFVCASVHVAEYLKEMRLELEQLMEEKISNPKLDLVSYPRGKLIIDTIVKLISTE
jgi:ATP-dependent RNA helicase DHX57